MDSVKREPGRPKQAVTLKDIGVRCGVSKQAVHRVLNGDPKISKAKTTEILAAAAEMGYDPSQHHSARRLAARKVGKEPINQVIAYISMLGSKPDYYIDSILCGAWSTSVEQNYGLLLGFWPSHAIPPILKRGEVDGAIMFTLAPTPEDLNYLDYIRTQTQFGSRPIVSLLSTLPGCSAVLSDDREGARMAVSHLLDLGHRHLLHYYQQPANEISLHRLEGYRAAYMEHGLDPDAYLIAVPWPSERNSDAIPFTLEVLRAHPEVTGILARHDSFACELIFALQREGFRVPEDISVMGHDDTMPFLDREGNNILSTVHMELTALGRYAAQLTIDRVTGKVKEDKTAVYIPSLAIRGTTSFPRV